MRNQEKAVVTVILITTLPFNLLFDSVFRIRMKTCLLIIAMVFGPAISHAQTTLYPNYAKLQVLDTIRTVVQYNLVYYKNHENKSTDGWNHPISVKMTVEVGDRIRHSYTSMERESDLFMMDEEVAGRGRRNNPPTMHAQIGELYMGTPDKELTMIINLQVAGMYKYEEPIPQIEWLQTEEHKSIRGIECRKATTRFRGRDYIVWYAPDIPLPYGPWKFHGLPGLIVELVDAGEDYHFTLEAIATPESTEYIYWWDRGYVSMTKKKCLKTQDVMLKNPSQFWANYGRILRVGGDDYPECSNNPIELSE